MKERAIVEKTSGKIAFVRIEKHPECDGCKICAFKNGKSSVRVKAYNRCGARVGDAVAVQAERDNRLLASLIVYIVPVLFAGAGALIGAFAVGKEVWAAVLCLAGLALGFVAVYALDKLLGKTRGFGMEITEILQNKDTEQKIQSEEVQDGKGI